MNEEKLFSFFLKHNAPISCINAANDFHRELVYEKPRGNDLIELKMKTAIKIAYELGVAHGSRDENNLEGELD